MNVPSYCDTFSINLLHSVLRLISYHKNFSRFNTEKSIPKLHHERTQQRYGCFGLLYEHVTDSQLDKDAGWDGTQPLVYSVIGLLIAQKTMSLAGLLQSMV